MKTIIDTSIRVGIATITRRKMSLSMRENRRTKAADGAGPSGHGARPPRETTGRVQAAGGGRR
ncbi:hypothetical protein ACOTEP_19060, partial [Achromobacter xylosoxidans]